MNVLDWRSSFTPSTERKISRKLRTGFSGRRARPHHLDDGSVDGSTERWLQFLDRPNDFLIPCNDIHEIRVTDRAIRWSRSEIVCSRRLVLSSRSLLRTRRSDAHLHAGPARCVVGFDYLDRCRNTININV
jgi:hypothetical protein